MTFSEAVEVSAGRPHFEFSLGPNGADENKQAAYESGSGTTALVFAYTVQPGDQDQDGIWIGDHERTLKLDSGEYIRSVSTMFNAHLAHSELGTQSSHKVDAGTPPTVSSVAVTSSPDTGTTYAADEKIQFTVTFSEAVEVSAGRPHFEFSLGPSGGAVTKRAAYESGSGTTALVFAYTVQGGDQDDDGIWVGDGSDTLKLDSGEYIRSVAHMVNAALTHSELGTQSGHKVDAGAPPTVSSVAVTSSPNNSTGYITDEKIRFTVTFSEAVEVSTGRPHFEFSTSLGTRQAAYESGSGTTALVFAYTVQAADWDDNGIWIGDGSDTLKLDSGEYIRSVATMNNARLAHSSLGTQSGHKVIGGITGITSVAVTSSPDEGDVYYANEKIEFTVTFSGAVEVSAGRPHFEFSLGPSGGGSTKQAAYESGSGTTALVFAYTVQAGDQDNDGIWIGDGSDTLKLDSGEYIRIDGTMNNARLVHARLGRQRGHKVGVNSVTVTGSGATEGAPVTFTLQRRGSMTDPLTVNVTVIVSGDMVAPGNKGAKTVTIAANSAEATHSVATVDDEADERDGFVALGVQPGDGYVRGERPWTRAEVVDNDVVLTSARIDGATLVLTFSDPLDESSVPTAPGGFTATVSRSGSPVDGHTVSGIAVSGARVTLTLARAVLVGDAVTLAYEKPPTPLRDRAMPPNEVADFTTGSGGVPRVVNRTAALEVTLSKARVTEGDDATVTLTVAVADGGTSSAARAIAVAAAGTPSATETGDWTLDAGAKTLAAGARNVTFAVAVVDDARLEGDESVTFAVTADGAAVGEATLAIADDDRAALAIVGPEEPATEGGTGFALKLRLEPHPDNGPPIADDACFLDFPVTATLSVESGASELSGSPSLPADYDFPATSFEDCTREVTVDLATRASDGSWERDRTVSFALARKTGQDDRIDPGAGEVTVRDDTPPPGPLVERVAMPAPPPGAGRLSGPYRTRDAFYNRNAVPDNAVHGEGRGAEVHPPFRPGRDGRGRASRAGARRVGPGAAGAVDHPGAGARQHADALVRMDGPEGRQRPGRHPHRRARPQRGDHPLRRRLPAGRPGQRAPLRHRPPDLRGAARRHA